MRIDTNDILNSILQSLDHVDYIRPEEIPNIELYMDQVTTFMDDHFPPQNDMAMIRYSQRQ